MAETGSESPSSITSANLEEEREAIEPQADGDSTDVDTVPADGRISGLPPNYDESDPSEQEAQVQQDERQDNPDSIEGDRR